MSTLPPEKDFIFGIHPVIEAIQAGKTIDKLFIQKGLQGQNASELRQLVKLYEIPTQYVPVEKLNRLTGKNHQGVFAFVSPIAFYDIETLLPQIYEQARTPLILILDGITDVRNFGAIARSAECTGVDAIIISQKFAAPINGDSMKTSAGALNNIPICKVANFKPIIDYLQMSGVQIVGASEKSTTSIYQVDLVSPTAIVMGSESYGLSDTVLKQADILAKLPIVGQTASLNVSVACGLFYLKHCDKDPCDIRIDRLSYFGNGKKVTKHHSWIGI